MLVLSVPAIVALEITPTCNNRCPGCSNVYADDRHSRPPLSARDWQGLLRPFVEETVQIRLTGGEPTLHPGFFEIFEEATSYEAWVTVFTNGRWIEPKRLVERIRGRRHFSGLLVSLHGASAESHEAFSGVAGSFEETLNNIRLALDNDITVALSTVITRSSWDQIEDVVDLGERLGVHHVAFNRYIGRSDDEVAPSRGQLRAAIDRIEALADAGADVKYGIGIPQCFQLNRSEGCLAGVAYASIDPWGRLRPCAHSPTIIGSLREGSMEELWHSDKMNNWRQRVPEACTNCGAYSTCHGGCRAVQELRRDHRDPLRGEPFKLDRREATDPVGQLPADGRPQVNGRLRKEPFGIALLGRGQVVPLHLNARAILQACDGQTTFAELEKRFGAEGIDLLGELWQRGFLDTY